MEIKFKYTSSEMEALRRLFERTVCNDSSNEPEERLLIAVLINVYLRIVKNMLQFKSKYALKYKPEEAIAFYLYFKTIPAVDTYEIRLINMTIDVTDRKLL